MKEITIDMLYDAMRAYVHKEQRRPTHLLIHPNTCSNISEDNIIRFGYNVQKGKVLMWQDVQIIRTFDIEENRIIFLS